jgi:hypothetical protein
MRMMRSQDFETMLNQLENLARSGSRDEARKLLSEMQRMMNNMQTARPRKMATRSRIRCASRSTGSAN